MTNTDFQEVPIGSLVWIDKSRNVYGFNAIQGFGIYLGQEYIDHNENKQVLPPIYRRVFLQKEMIEMTIPINCIYPEWMAK